MTADEPQLDPALIIMTEIKRAVMIRSAAVQLKITGVAVILPITIGSTAAITIEQGTAEIKITVDEVIQFSHIVGLLLGRLAKKPEANICVHAAVDAAAYPKRGEIGVIHCLEILIVIPYKCFSHNLRDALRRAIPAETAVSLELKQICRKMCKNDFLQYFGKHAVCSNTAALRLDLEAKTARDAAVRLYKIIPARRQFDRSIRREKQVFGKAGVSIITVFRVVSFMVPVHSFKRDLVFKFSFFSHFDLLPFV